MVLTGLLWLMKSFSLVLYLPLLSSLPPPPFPFLLGIYTEVMRGHEYSVGDTWHLMVSTSCHEQMDQSSNWTGWAGRPRGKGLLAFHRRRIQQNLELKIWRQLWEPTWAWCAEDGTVAKWEIGVPAESPRPTDTCSQTMNRFWTSNEQNGDYS